MVTAKGSISRGLRISCLIGVVLLCFLCGSTRASTARRQLATVSQIQSCISPCGATVVFPGTAAYAAAQAQAYQHRNLYAPAAIVFATSVAQVQNAVRCAVKLNIGISPRSGGHSYEDYSLGGRNGVLVVDLGGLTQFSYDSKSMTAIVGAGFRLGPLKLALWNAGKVTIPSADYPSIGIGGHALGGGWGLVSRKFGILSDSILEAQVVINNGSVVTANAVQNSDLLQALKGAGANSFGIVTQFTFKVYDVSYPVTYFKYQFFGPSQEGIIRAFQIWGATAVGSISASLYQDPFGTNELYGLYLGPQQNLQPRMQVFFNNAPAPLDTYIVQIDYIQAVMINGGFSIESDPTVLNLQSGAFGYPEGVSLLSDGTGFKAKSLLSNATGFSDAGIGAFIVNIASPFYQVAGQFTFDLFGGTHSAMNNISVKPGDGWVHRDSLINIQMFAGWTDPQNAAIYTDFIETLWDAVRPYASSEAYQNYIDVEEPLSAYYGSNLASLEATKRKWDSKNVFNFNQSIPLS